MNDPRRLKDDPAFQSETGCDLDAEQLVVGGYDLPGLKARVLQGGTPPPPPSAPWWKVTLASAGTAAVVSLAIAFLVQPSPIVAVPPSSPPPEVIATGPQIPVQRHVEVPSPEELPPPPRPTAAVQESEPVAAPSPPLPSPAAAEAPAPSGLAAELAEYNLARDHREAGRWSEAEAGYRAYLERWPTGRLRTEARLGLLSALVGSGKTEQAASLAARLTADPTLAHKHAELTLVRAEALVSLGRCDEATGLVEGLKRSPRSTTVKQTCRKQRK